MFALWIIYKIRSISRGLIFDLKSAISNLLVKHNKQTQIIQPYSVQLYKGIQKNDCGGVRVEGSRSNDRKRDNNKRRDDN